MVHATFARPDLTTFCRLDELGLQVIGRRLEPQRAVLINRVVEADQWCPRRVQQEMHGHRGRKEDPLYRARRTLHTGHDLFTDRQRQRLTALFGVEDHVQVEATWGIYQRMIAAYRETDRSRGKQLMTAVIESVTAGVPAVLTTLHTVGRTLTKRAEDVLAYFDRTGTSNGPTEAMNGRLEQLARLRPRLPQPHQLHRQEPARDRRVQTATTPWIVKSRVTTCPATQRSPCSSGTATRPTARSASSPPTY